MMFTSGHDGARLLPGTPRTNDEPRGVRLTDFPCTVANRGEHPGIDVSQATQARSEPLPAWAPKAIGEAFAYVSFYGNGLGG